MSEEPFEDEYSALLRRVYAGIYVVSLTAWGAVALCLAAWFLP